MPQMKSALSPRRLALRCLALLQASPATYNAHTLAAELDERPARIQDVIQDIEQEFSIIREGQNQVITVLRPGKAVVL